MSPVLGVLHGINAVAALKPFPHGKDAPAAKVLHGINAVAALKLGQLCPGAGSRAVLHGINAVAALKPVGRYDDPHGPGCSPRHQRRGRIEADDRFFVYMLGRGIVLHGINAVAALKLPDLCQRLNRSAQVLHGINAVAALKLNLTAHAAAPVNTFSTASTPWPH